MKYKIFTVLFLLLGLTFNAQAEEKQGYSIELDVPNQPNTKAYLAAYWENTSYAIDSVILSDSGRGTLESNQYLSEGQYMLYIPSSIQLDLLITKEEQNLHLYINDTDITKCKVKGSKDTKRLWEYLHKQEQYFIKNEELKSASKEDKNMSDAELQLINEKAERLSLEYTQYVDKLADRYYYSWFGTFLKGTITPKVPHSSVTSQEQLMENHAILKKHYFDNMNLSDPRMWTTNYFTQFIDQYMEQYVDRVPDSLADAAIDLVEKSKGDPVTFQRMLSRFVNSSQESNLMGYENIWARLFEKYILNKDLPWIDSVSHSELHMNYELIKNNMIGSKAKNMMLTSIDGEIINTNKIDAEYLVLFFYDTSCSFCIKETPILHDDIYAKYKEKGMKVVAINTHPPSDYNTESWRSHVDKYKLHDWTNVNDPNYKSEYWLNYNTQSTPAIYLLDKDKTIIGKDINSKDIDTILEFYLK